jgi:hypothetical protein
MQTFGKARPMLKATSMSAYAYFAIVGGLGLLACANLAAPGCSGPPSAKPCDFFQIAKDAVSDRRGFSERWGMVALDDGSSAYVRDHQPPSEIAGILHTPGVLIDRRSCRVCRVDGYAALLEDERRTLMAIPPKPDIPPG